MNVIKRDGTIQPYDSSKIFKAILSAFNATGKAIDAQGIRELVSQVAIRDNIPIEQIQDQVEFILMRAGHFEVAKAFILYREEHKNERELVGMKQYIKDYMKSQNAATGSKFDSNANVTMKNVTTLAGELQKGKFIQLNRSRMRDMNMKLWGPVVAKEYDRMLESHELYKHDETAPIYPYCVAITMYPMLLNGLRDLGGISRPPKHLRSFCGIFVNMVFTIAAQFAGAVATPEFLMYFDYFCRKEWGEDYWKDFERVVEQSNTKVEEVFDPTVGYYQDLTQENPRTIEQVIEDYFQNVVYYLNQPAAARNFQCVTEDTQLWTPQGFKYLKELKEGDSCYVWVDGKYKIQKINKLNVYNYNSDRDGQLLRFSGRNYQQTVTPSHRVVYKIPNTNRFAIKEARELWGHSKLSCPISGILEREEDYPIWDELLKLCTYALTDGSIVESHGKYKITYYLSPSRAGFNEVIQSLSSLGIGYTVVTSKVSRWGTVQEIRLTATDSYNICRQLENTKKKLPGFFRKVSQRQARIILDCWSKSDGQQLRDGRLLMQCDNEEIASALQEVVLLAGYGSSIEYHKTPKLDGTEGRTLYVATYLRDCKRVSNYEKVSYTGKVWCPTTDAGVVVFRESNGVPYISGNSVFWNISYFDKNYFEGIFGDFVFPDGTKPSWESLDWLQRKFMKWFNKERTKDLLTFPVESMALLSDGYDVIDKEYADFTAEMQAEGHSFFVYMSDSPDSLSSCCRLRNEVQENQFSYSLGAGGVATGSKSVMTLNINRLVQDAIKKNLPIKEYLREKVQLVHKFQTSYNELLKEFYEAGMLTVYNAGFIDLRKQYLTIGVNGVVEAAEFLGIKAKDTEDYQAFIQMILSTISEENKKARTKELMFNCEFVPAENLGVKHAKWDKEAGYEVPRDCYNSYFYAVEDSSLNILEKFRLHGKKYVGYLDGGSALHMNLEEHLSKEQYRNLLKVAAREGTNYFTYNIPNTICNDCGHIDKRYLKECPSCGSKNVDYATRVIGYLKRVSSFSMARQEEASKRFYYNGSKDECSNM